MALIRRQNRKAEYRTAVVFACDEGHLPFALFATDRILRTEPGEFDLVICMPDISMVSEEHMSGPVRFCEVDMSALPKVPMVKDWISFATYFRWVLPQAFEGELDTFLYLDTDTYLRRPGLQSLFDSIQKPLALGAITEFQRFVDLGGQPQINFDQKLHDLGGKNGEYFNAGVLLFQPEPYLEMDGPARFEKAAVANVPFLPMHKDQDQGAMNLAFADDIEPINPLYNWRSFDWMHEKMVKKFDPILLHFAGRGKPWNRPDDPFILSFAKEYNRYLSRHFPDLKPKALKNTGGWRYDNPKHRIKALEHIRVALHRRRINKPVDVLRYRQFDEKAQLMQAEIDACVLGREKR